MFSYEKLKKQNSKFKKNNRFGALNSTLQNEEPTLHSMPSDTKIAEKIIYEELLAPTYNIPSIKSAVQIESVKKVLDNTLSIGTKQKISEENWQTSPSVEYSVQIKNIKQPIDSTCKYSELTKLTESDINNCMNLQETMFLNMKEKCYSFDFIRKRTREDFLIMLKSNQLFGVSGDTDKNLIGIVSIARMSKDDALSHITSNNNSLLVDNSLAKILHYKNGCYFSCLMTDLNKNRNGLANHIMSSVGKIAQEYGYDYSIGEIHVQNPASYKACTKIDATSFAISNKTVSFINVNGDTVTIPVLYFVSIYNNSIGNIFKKMFEKAEPKPFEYSQDIVDLIMNSKNSDSDVVLKKDEVIRFIDGKLVKIRLNLEPLEKFLDSKWCDFVKKRSSSCVIMCRE